MTTKGEPLFELNDFRNALAYIQKYKNYIVAYNEGGAFGELITIYDLEKESIVRRIGEKTNEHILLMTLEGSGGLAVDSDRIVFSYADQPSLFTVDVEDFSQEEVPADIPGFVVENIERAPTEIVNGNRQKLFEFLASNSRVTNVFELDDFFLLEAQTGYIETKNDSGINFENRVTNFAVFDKDLKQIDRIRFSDTKFSRSNLKEGILNQIYLIHQEIDHDNMSYKLAVYELEKL